MLRKLLTLYKSCIILHPSKEFFEQVWSLWATAVSFPEERPILGLLASWHLWQSSYAELFFLAFFMSIFVLCMGVSLILKPKKESWILCYQNSRQGQTRGAIKYKKNIILVCLILLSCVENLDALHFWIVPICYSLGKVACLSTPSNVLYNNSWKPTNTQEHVNTLNKTSNIT